MKKTLKSILIVLLSITAVVFGALGLSACGEPTLEGIRILNAQTSFKVGDEFEYGDGFAVYARYSDGSETDVTEEISVRYENGFDMNVAGDYQITVSWGGKREIYTIYVSDFDSILRKIELDTTDVKKTFELGESIAFAGLKVICTYENAQGQLIEEQTTSLKNFDVEVKSEDNIIAADVFDKLGKFTVTVSSGGIKASFEVNVDGVNISTVQGAIAAGSAFRGNIVSGTHKVNEGKYNGEKYSGYPSLSYEYEFGINYTHIKENLDPAKDEYHYSIEDEQIFCVHFQNGSMVNDDSSQTGMMFGTPFRLWYARATEFGIENTLSYLYKAGKECTNKDLEESADPQKRKYSFSFTGLVFNSNNNDYYETTVAFELGDDYTITYAKFTQDYYENSNGITSETFKTDAAGHTTPVSKYAVSKRMDVEVYQVSGERTLENPYTRDSLRIKSYDLTYNGISLGDNGVINCDIKSPNLTIKIENIMPDTASFSQDPMYFDYEGNYGVEVDSSTFLEFEGFMAFRNSSQNTISILLRNGGTWVLKIRTASTNKTVTFNVKGVAPTSMTAQVGNGNTGKFYAATQKTVALGGAVYFTGVVNKYANAAQTAVVTSSNSGTAQIEKATFGGVDCFKFTASAEGVYTVKVSSDANSEISCTFTFTVSDMPDYSEILRGTYKVTDYEGNIFTLVFNPESAEGEVSGTVTVTKTPTTEDNVPEYDKKKTQVLNYSVNFDNLTINLNHVSGDNLGIDLSLNDDNELMLEDQYGTLHKLEIVS